MASDRIQQHIARLLDEAEEAVRELRWGTVSKRAQAVLAFEPADSDALTFSAAAERALGGVKNEEAPAAAPTSTEPRTSSFQEGRYVVKQLTRLAS